MTGPEISDAELKALYDRLDTSEFQHVPKPLQLDLVPRDDRDWDFYNFWENILESDDDETWATHFGEERTAWHEENETLAALACRRGELGKRADDALIELVRRDPRYLATRWTVALVLEARFVLSSSTRVPPHWNRTRPFVGDQQDASPEVAEYIQRRAEWRKERDIKLRTDRARVESAKFLFELGQAVRGTSTRREPKKGSQSRATPARARRARVKPTINPGDVRAYFDDQLKALQALKSLIRDIKSLDAIKLTQGLARKIAFRLAIAEPGFVAFWESSLRTQRGDTRAAATDAVMRAFNIKEGTLRKYIQQRRTQGEAFDRIDAKKVKKEILRDLRRGWPADVPVTPTRVSRKKA